MHPAWIWQRMVVLVVITFVWSSSTRAEVLLAKDQKTEWRIYSPSTNAAAQFAVAELRRYFTQISQAELPLTKKEKSKHCIVVGLRSELSKKNLALLPPSQAGYDGYTEAIFEKPEQIIIAGDNECGLIYGVYDFLEQLGCRWFYPTQNPNDPEVVPQRNRVSAAAGSRAVSSRTRYRICNGSSWFFQMDYVAAKKQIDWAMKNRYNAMGWQAAVAGDKKSLLQQHLELQTEGVLSELQ